ncbi:hypothetical protein Cgig2_021701 [Carnegiea gigantea]|uniref:Uncharacterized protein n=1 Tax=Carnegiea gigantea TaxID=171969 RepID=A0A9Q1KV83_9CARY|nr:hypothetical protein Cgig2_021701 [Carnegiea gigantea]
MASHNPTINTTLSLQPSIHTEQLAPLHQTSNTTWGILKTSVEEVLELVPTPPHVPSYMDELIALCLMAVLWGKILPIALIIAKTKFDWKHVKGQVEYIDLGNGKRLKSSKDKGKAVVTEVDPLNHDAEATPAILEGVHMAELRASRLLGGPPTLPYELFSNNTHTIVFSSTTLLATQPLSPTSPLERIPSPIHEEEGSS